MAAAIDRRTGKVVWLPFTVCCWPMTITEPLEYRLESTLLIVHGKSDEKGDSGTHYYRLAGSRFVAAAR